MIPLKANNFNHMKTFIYFITILTCLSTQVFGQTNNIVSTVLDTEREARLDSLINDIFLNDPQLKSLLSSSKPINMHYLYYRSSYSTSTIFAGREIGEDQINVGNQLYYLNGSGLYLGLSGYWYNQLDPGYRTTVLTAGYTNNLFNIKALRVRLSYQRYISHISDPLYQPLYKQGISSGLTLSNDKIGLRLDGGLNFGDFETGKSLSAGVYGNIQLYKKDARKKIKLRPEVYVLYGIDYQEFMLDESLIDPYTGIEYTSYYQDKFGLMNIQFNLPLYINYKNFDFQINYQYNIPQNFVDDIKYPNLSAFQFSVGYFFNIGK